MEEINLVDCSKKLCIETIKKFESSPIADEANLISFIRERSGFIFVSFLEYFINYCQSIGYVICSKYALKIIIKNQGNIKEKDIITNRIGVEDKTDFIINDYIAVSPIGTNIKYMQLLGLEASLQHIRDSINSLYPAGINDLRHVNIYKQLDIDSLLSVIYSEFDKKYAPSDSLLHKET